MNKSYTSETEQSLTQLAQLHASLVEEVSEPIEWPELAGSLNIEKRRGDQIRIFKHIHQHCLMHVHNFLSASKIKLVYVAGAYLDAIQSENPIAVYGAGRSALEFTAFLYYTTERLLEITKQDPNNWIVAGQKFFSSIVRARFATGNPEHTTLLANEGIPKDSLRPPRVADTLRTLENESGFKNIRQEYSMLCDYVHHSLSSQTISNAGTFTANAARSSGGGAIFLKTPGPITRYEYPSHSKFIRAVEQTAILTHRYVQTAVRWIGRCPESPFTPKQILQFTGTEFGLTPVVSAQVKQKPKSKNTTTGRNELCPCGSGKKYKRCCLNSS
jgi:hypothetical protein